MPKAAVAALVVLGMLVAGCANPGSPTTPAGRDAGTVPAAAPPGSDPGPAAGGSLVPLDVVRSTDVSSGGEPSILTDRHGKFVWVGDTSGTYWSDDNGTTFHPMTYPTDIGVAFGDGVALAQDDVGTLYAAYLHDNRIDVASSTDGKTFDGFTVGGVFDTVDRPWIGAHGDGEVALFYIDAVGLVYLGGSAHCARSTDHGQTFADRRPLSANPQGGKAFYDGAGAFYYAQEDGRVAKFATTCLGGGQQLSMVGSLGENNMIQADAAGTDVYMAATDASHHIVVAGRREDGSGKTLTVSDNRTSANTYASVSPTLDEVAVAWYGSQSSGDPFAAGFSGDWAVYVARIQHFWSDHPVIDVQQATEVMHHGYICNQGATCPTGSRGLLDYFMADHDLYGGLHIAYVDDTASPHVRYLHLAPAAIVALPADPTPTDTPSDGEEPSDEPAPTSASGRVTASFTSRIHGLELAVDAGSSGGEAPLSYAWTFGDGAAGTGVTTQHAYAKAGTYRIGLTVTDGSGQTATSDAVATLQPGADGAVKSTPVPSDTPVPSSKKGPGPALPLLALALLGVVAVGLRRRR